MLNESRSTEQFNLECSHGESTCDSD